MIAKQRKANETERLALHKPRARVSLAETAQLNQCGAELSGDTAFHLNDLAGGANLHVPVFSSNAIFDRTAGGMFKGSGFAGGGENNNPVLRYAGEHVNPDSRRLVKNLLAKRPNEKQWKAFKQAFSDCEAKRSTFAVNRLLFSGACIAFLSLSINSLLGSLAFFFFISAVGCLLPALICKGGIIRDLAEHRYPLPRTCIGGHSDAEPALDSFNPAKLTESDRRRFENSPGTQAYLDGVSKKEVPLLVMDLDILERIFTIDTQYERLSGNGQENSREQGNSQMLTQTAKA